MRAHSPAAIASNAKSIAPEAQKEVNYNAFFFHVHSAGHTVLCFEMKIHFIHVASHVWRKRIEFEIERNLNNLPRKYKSDMPLKA